MTSEMGEMFNTMRDGRKALRAAHGQPCPKCVELLPKTHPSILLPQGVCKIHHYRDPRPRLTIEQENKTYKDAGIELERSK